MLVLVSSFANTNGVVFPDTEAINATGSGATDGTEFVKIMVDHTWGSSQALLNYAGMTPNGIQEADGASQLLEATGKAFGIGPGFGTIWWGDEDPAVLGYRVLLLNGQGILRVNYAELDAAVYVGDAENSNVHAGGGFFYRADNSDGSSPNIAGAYLILPETRGYTLRGLDPSGGVDPGGATRFLGDVQDFALENITGAMQLRSDSGGSDIVGSETGVFAGSPGSTTISLVGSATTQARRKIDFDASTVVQTSTETRMTNVSVKYGITY